MTLVETINRLKVKITREKQRGDDLEALLKEAQDKIKEINKEVDELKLELENAKKETEKAKKEKDEMETEFNSLLGEVEEQLDKNTDKYEAQILQYINEAKAYRKK